MGTKTFNEFIYDLNILKSAPDTKQELFAGNVDEIHGGFLAMFQGAAGQMVDAVKYILHREERQGNLDNIKFLNPKFQIVGHSLGGALSILMAYHLKTEIMNQHVSDKRYSKFFIDNYLKQKDLFQIVIFGSPRSISHIGAYKFEKQIGKYNIEMLLIS